MPTIDGKYVPPELCTGDWTLQDDTECGNKEGQYQENLVAEAIEISGTPLNVFKLLGVHEQGKLLDLTGSGYPLSSGSQAGYDASNAFIISGGTWRSVQQGTAVSTTPAFIGYNFGNKKTSYGVDKYAPNQPVRQHITTIRITQSADPLMRVLQARIESSKDGVTWTRVDIVNLPDTDTTQSIAVKQSYPAPFWRLVPLLFKGAADSNAYWEIQKLELMDYMQTSIDNVQDVFFMENRDRDYATSSLQVKAVYQPFDSMGDMSKFGFNILDSYTFEASFAKMVEILGRPIVIGDIIELPAELQYDHNLRAVKKYLEVSDAAWSSNGYTTGWRPTLYRFVAQHLIPAAENRDIIGTIENQYAVSDSEFLTGIAEIDGIAHTASENIEALAKDAVPEDGQDAREQHAGESSHAVGKVDSYDYGVEDGLPPNGLPYGEGFALPDVLTAVDGSYYRLNYPVNTKIPSRLYKFSVLKNKWIYIETDRRMTMSSFKPSARAIMNSTNSKPISSDKV
jgi:hypothetical protein